MDQAMMTTTLSVQRPTDVRGWLRQLRRQLGTGRLDPEIADSLDGLSQALDQLVAEHEGMSSELIGVYEQLGVIFEITRELPTVRHEHEVFDLFLSSLRRSFHGASVSLARPTDHDGWAFEGDPVDGEAWIRDHLDVARQSTRGLVERRSGSFSEASADELMVGPIFAGEEFLCAIVLLHDSDAPEFQASDLALVESLAMFCGDLIGNHRLVDELREMSMAMVRSLVNAVDQKDPYTCGHSIRVGYFASLLGEHLGLSDGDLQMLQWSALLHDVGKIGIRDDVLNKNGPLTDEEFDHIKEHPVRSHQVVSNIAQLAGALDGVLHHHEHYDGTGYPTGLTGDQIPLQARIIQIADVFDALTSTRSYRGAYDWSDALAVLDREAGKTVDPKLCPIFSELIRGELDGKPGAWSELLERAGRFASGSWNTEV